MTDFRQKMISFHELDALDIQALKFVTLATKNFPPVVKKPGESVFFEREAVDKDLFIQGIFQLVAIPANVIEGILLIAVRESLTFKYYSIVYLKDRQLLPIVLEVSVNFQTWVETLIAGMKEAKNYLFRITENGLSLRPLPGLELFKDLVKLLKQEAPRAYSQEKMQQEKIQKLSSWKLTASMHQTIATDETLRLWEKTCVQTEQHRSEGKNNPPAQAQLFAQFDKITLLAFPQELKVIYQKSDGGLVLADKLRFMPLQEIIQEWKNWKKIFDEWSWEDLTSAYSSEDEKTLGMYCNPRWIPFMDAGSGNYIAWDGMPGTQGKRGQIIAFGADQDTIPCLAENLNVFLAQQLKSK